MGHRDTNERNWARKGCHRGGKNTGQEDQFDPELSDINGYVYPIMRNFSFGINVTL